MLPNLRVSMYLKKTEEASDKLSKEADKLKDKNTSRVK